MKRRDMLAVPLALALFGAGTPFAAEPPEISIYLNPN
jgi:hypothetical protein